MCANKRVIKENIRRGKRCVLGGFFFYKIVILVNVKRSHNCAFNVKIIIFIRVMDFYFLLYCIVV